MSIQSLLIKASQAYYEGSPIMTNEEFDKLESNYKIFMLGTIQADNTVKHLYKMYSLAKVYDAEEYNVSSKEWVESPKLDGAAVQLTYVAGKLAIAATRGDGVQGQNITEKMALIVPNELGRENTTQIVGEVVVKDKTIENSRNYASGALNLKDVEEFKSRIPNLIFIAYSMQQEVEVTKYYTQDMVDLTEVGFDVVLEIPEHHTYPVDGTVFRVNSNKEFKELGYTSRFPRGAYARKLSSDVEIVETELLSVVWQVGGSGKVTPVANFEEVIIDDAKVSRATLHNPGFIEDMGLEIGDTLLVTRSGGVIPKVLGKL